MNLRKTIAIINAAVKVKAFAKRLPLVVGWAITNRCNRACLYCNRRNEEDKELSTPQVIAVINVLAGAGTVRISFTGGEPLMRDDIGEIIDHAHNKGIETKLNSNGALVPSRMGELRNLDVLTLSLEGPEDIHDAIRGRGSFSEVMEAAGAAKKNNVRLAFATVLTRHNLGAVEFLLETAKRFGTNVIFQPATQLILGGKDPNPVVPPCRDYRRVVEFLIEEKKRRDSVIANSVAGLKHLYNWPTPKYIRCASGIISCRIEPNGDVLYCSREEHTFEVSNCVRDGFLNAFYNLKPIRCGNCWCASRVELNLAMGGNVSAITNQLQALRQ